MNAYFIPDLCCRFTFPSKIKSGHFLYNSDHKKVNKHNIATGCKMYKY